jgi:hypothetical protein
MHSNTFAARAGRCSAKNRKKAIWSWRFRRHRLRRRHAVAVRKPSNQNDNVGQSGQAEKRFDNHFPDQDDESVIIQAHQGRSADGPEVRKAVDAVIAAVRGSLA